MLNRLVVLHPYVQYQVQCKSPRKSGSNACQFRYRAWGKETETWGCQCVVWGWNTRKALDHQNELSLKNRRFRRTSGDSITDRVDYWLVMVGDLETEQLRSFATKDGVSAFSIGHIPGSIFRHDVKGVAAHPKQPWPIFAQTRILAEGPINDVRL